MFEFAAIQPATPATAVEAGSGMLETKWFPGLEFNFGAHLLRFDDDRIALEAEDGESALALIRCDGGLRVELAVLDVVMPRMDGRELGERLRTERPGIGVL